MFLIGCDNQNIIKEQSSVPEKIQNDDYGLQEICKTGCDEYFKKQYFPVSSYQSHYNKKLNKCFILIEDVKKPSKDLYSINESIHYGMFFRDRDGVYCNVLDTECASEKEWDSIVKHYMEE